MVIKLTRRKGRGRQFGNRRVPVNRRQFAPQAKEGRGALTATANCQVAQLNRYPVLSLFRRVPAPPKLE
jgi:hypothetical protein